MIIILIKIIIIIIIIIIEMIITNSLWKAPRQATETPKNENEKQNNKMKTEKT